MSARQCECGAAGRHPYPIGGGWAFACDACRAAAEMDAAVGMPGEGIPPEVWQDWHRNGPANARFWTYVHGDLVKLTLRPGQTLEHSEGGPTEEGYHWLWIEWTLHHDHVTRFTREDSRDCDGRVTDEEHAECALDQLSAHEFEGTRFPQWERSHERHRDYNAEAAGY